MPALSLQTLKNSVVFFRLQLRETTLLRRSCYNPPAEDEPFQQTLYQANLVQNIITHFESSISLPASIIYALCISVEGGKRSVYQQCNLESSAASPVIFLMPGLSVLKGKINVS